MKQKNFFLTAVLILFCCSCFGQTASTEPGVTPRLSGEQQLVAALLGTWEIDLRPSPESAPYIKDFTVKAYEQQALKGVFYDTGFSNGRIHTAWGKLYFAFTTADGSGTYYHSGFLEDGRLTGISFSPNRQFVMPWTGVRKK